VTEHKLLRPSFSRLQRYVRDQNFILLAVIFVSALLIRIYHLGTMPIDMDHGTYARWLISALTLENHGFYSDLKEMPNLTIALLPLFQYVSAFFMLITGSKAVLVPRAISVFSGALTCAVVYLICLRLYRQNWFAVIGGMVLAFQPWHIDYSTLGTSVVFTGLLVVLMIHCFLLDRIGWFSIFSALAMITAYEGWFFIFILTVLGFLRRGWRGKRLLYPIAVASAVCLGWTGWSILNTGDPAAWVKLSLYMMFPLGWEIHLSDPAIFLDYFNLSLTMTFFMLYIGIVFGVLRGREPRLLVVILLAYMLFFSTAKYLGLDYGYEWRLITTLPLVAMVVPPAFPKKSMIKRITVVSILVILVASCFLSQIWIFPTKVYIVMPDQRMGLKLNENYVGGKILCDSPIVIYYSEIGLSEFMSYDLLDWHLKTPDSRKLADWLKTNNVKLIVWMAVPYSKAMMVFPELQDADPHKIGDVSLELVYEDSYRLYMMYKELKLRGIVQQNPYAEHAFPWMFDILVYKVT